MLNIINSFQNKDGDKNILNQAPYSKNNVQLNIQQKYEFQLIHNKDNRLNKNYILKISFLIWQKNLINEIKNLF